MPADSTQPKACPSARAEPGNLLYGRVAGVQVERLGTPLPVDTAFVAEISANGPPEQRFRFTGRCHEGQCAQWTGTGCGVIERVLTELSPQPPATTLPRCAIRATCRWFAQRGAEACQACTLVVTDTREPLSVGV